MLLWTNIQPLQITGGLKLHELFFPSSHVSQSHKPPFLLNYFSRKIYHAKSMSTTKEPASTADHVTNRRPAGNSKLLQYLSHATLLVPTRWCNWKIERLSPENLVDLQRLNGLIHAVHVKILLWCSMFLLSTSLFCRFFNPRILLPMIAVNQLLLHMYHTCNTCNL